MSGTTKKPRTKKNKAKPQREFEKAKDLKGTVKKISRLMGAYKFSVTIVFLFAAGSAIFSILGPKLLGNITTTIYEGITGKITGTSAGIDFPSIVNVIVILISLYLASALFSYIQGFIMSGVTMKITYQLRRDISLKINRMPLKYFESNTQGEILSRITNDVDTVSHTLNQSLTELITSVTTIIGVVVMMFYINWLMTLVALIAIPLSLVFVILIVKHSQKYFKQQQDFLGHVNGHIEEMFGGHIIMKAFNQEENSIAEFEEYNETLYKSAWKSQFLSGLMMPIMQFVGNLCYVLVCILGGYLVIRKTIQVGDIQSFIQYVRSFNQPIAQLGNISTVLQQTAAAAERVFEFLEEEEEIPESETPVTLSVQDRTLQIQPFGQASQTFEGNVDFSHVKFGYQEDNIIIHDFSAQVKSGQQIAIVGPTGAGKTTMVKLLMRFYDVNDGAILIDGQNIQEFPRNDLRSLFGMVLQDTWLYNETIRENIRYGRLDATDADVVAAAKSAHVHHFIKTLPGGYDMVLNEESSNISQGQKQLLTIARAILADPKILILDEATSSVDTRTEIRIQKAMKNLMQGRTCFIIAHRLSTIRDADLILVMNDGDIVEQGTHEALLAQGGFYYTLYNSQFEQASEA